MIFFSINVILTKTLTSTCRQFAAIGGWNVLKLTVADMGATSNLTKLIQDLRGVHPDDTFSAIPYEKGFAFLYYLETLVGGPGN